MRLFDRESGKTVKPSAFSLDEDFLLDSNESTVSWPEDLSSVAALRISESPAARLVSEAPEMGPAVEGFRLLGHRLRTIQRASGARRFLVTSSIPGEGKTLVCANLALILARASARVLLVECDMRKSGSGGAFGQASLPGLADWLEDRLPLSEALRRVEDHNLWTIPSGAPTRNPGELIQQRGMRQLLDGAAEKFDWVLVDSPPLNPFVDAQLLAGMTDSTLLVVRSGTTAKSEYRKSLKQLKGTTLAGVVVNGYDEPVRQDYYSYYSAKH